MSTSDNQVSPMIHSCRKLQRISTEEDSHYVSEFECGFLSMTDQMLIEILIRVPSKCACRSKVVCKRWYSLISTNYFINCFIDLHRQVVPYSFTLLFHYTKNIYSRPSDTKLCVRAIYTHPVLSNSYMTERVKLDFLPRDKAKSKIKGKGKKIKMEEAIEEPIRLEASCQDLLLYSHISTYYVTNLLTKQWIALPPAPCRRHERWLHRTCLDPSAGLLCYQDNNNPNNEDGWYRFKVILIPLRSSFCLSPDSYQPSVWVFCSESRRWTKFIADLRCTKYLFSTPILANNGMLHWIDGWSIVSLDPFNYTDGPRLRLSHRVNFPRQPFYNRGFGVSQGHLRLAGYCISDRSLLVWELEDYHKEVWRLAHKVMLLNSPLASYITVLKAMAFHPYDKDIIFVNLRDRIFIFNMGTGRVQGSHEMKVHDRDSYAVLKTSIPPLLHQWFPTPVPSPTPPPTLL